MSYTFSRRTFLKTSAVLAMAAATSGLLSGCEYNDPNNPVSTATNKKLEVAQTVGNLKSYSEDGVFIFELKNECGNPIRVMSDRFEVAVIDSENKCVYITGEDGNGIKVSSEGDRPDGWPNMEQNKTWTLRVEASNFPGMQVGDTVVFKYYPYDTTQTWAYSMSWKLTKEAAGEGAEG